MKKHEILEELAANEGWNLRQNYSGRGMYGETCVGIVTDAPMDCIEGAVSRGIRGARTDSMGLSTIVYWPKVQWPKSKKKNND